MPLEFIDLNSPPVVAVNPDNRKVMRKEKWHRTWFEKSTKKKKKKKNGNIEFRKKKIKWKSDLKSKNIQNVSSYYDKNWKVVTIYLIIVTVIIEIIVKMIVMLINKDNNK